MTMGAGSPPSLRSPAVLPGSQPGKRYASLPSSTKSRSISRVSRWEVSFTPAGARRAAIKFLRMISLETIGYFSDAPGSQIYPAPGLGLFYPSTGNFIGFVGNVGLACAGAPRHRALPATGKASLGRRRLALIHPGCRLVGPMGVLATRLSGDHDHRHRSVSVSSLSRGDRYAGQTRLRSLHSCGQRR